MCVGCREGHMQNMSLAEGLGSLADEWICRCVWGEGGSRGL